MPVTLEEPEVGGPIQVYAGDPKVIVIQINGQDRTADTFTADVRRRPQDPDVLMSFDVQTVLSGQNTVITLTLTGDSADGVHDGQTRKIQSTASFDVQEWDAFGAAVETVADGKLKVVQDVTR